MATSDNTKKSDANVQVTVGECTIVASVANYGPKLQSRYDVIINFVIDALPKAAENNRQAAEARVTMNEIDIAAGHLAIARLHEILTGFGFIVEFSIRQIAGQSDALTGITITPGELGWEPLFK